ncbi:MAG: hypothetical protein OSA98_16690 [Rubripirellula sp.]|nr:hypothetical protein [Rubripirellula sp.]
MKTMAHELTNFEDGFLKEERYLTMDRDATFSQSFRGFLRNEGVKPVRLPSRSQNLNAKLERFFGSLKSDCLHKLILFGETTTRRAVRLSSHIITPKETIRAGQRTDRAAQAVARDRCDICIAAPFTIVF